jgi:hypothetical protein
MSVSASHAALLLAQGSGRLIRTASDRGVVAVLDSRLATARYASFLRASMPDLWPTTDRGVVLAALRRLDAAAHSTGDAPPPGTDPVEAALQAVSAVPSTHERAGESSHTDPLMIMNPTSADRECITDGT